LPGAMRERFVRDFALTEYDASVMTQSKAMAFYFEAVVNMAGKEQAKVAANWLMGDVSSMLNRADIDIANSPISAEQLALLLKRIADNTITNKSAKEVLVVMWDMTDLKPTLADDIIESKGLKQISDSGALEKIIDEVMAANAKLVEDFRAGKDKAFNALVGQAMKATKGKGNPAQVNELLRKKLAG
jgi:aspartyl-tRNA(Asn)/glutamyl-tRNA(Gln) amidotransferase subunit B